MNPMPRRRYDLFPLILPLALSIAAGAWAGAGSSWLSLAVFALFFVLLLVTWLFVRRSPDVRKRLPVMAVCTILICLTGFGYGGWRRSSGVVAQVYADGEARVGGIVLSVRKADSTSVSFVVEADSFTVEGRGETVHVGECRCLVTARGGGAWRAAVVPGHRVGAVGRCAQVAPRRFARFDYSSYLQENGISAMVVADSVFLSQTPSPPGQRLRHIAQIAAGACQQTLQRSLEACGVGEGNIAFLRALLLGDRSLLRPEVSQAFRDCGTAHVLAVSGLHVGIVFGVIGFLLGLFMPSRGRLAGVLSLSLVWLYSVVVGLSPSVVRASLMISCAILGLMTRRRGSFLHPLYSAFAIQMVLDPCSALSLGLWLSYSAVFGILMAHHAIESLSPSNPFLRWCFASLAVSLVAQASTTPLTLFAFHTFPTYFWLNNLVIVPFMTVSLFASLVCLALSWVPYVGSALGFLTDKSLSLLTDYATVASGLPGAVVRDIPFGKVEMFGYAFLVLSLLVLLRTRRLHYLPLALGGLAAAIASTAVQEFVVSKQGTTLVYDCGQGAVGLSICRGSRAAHFCTDTLSASFLRTVDDLDARWCVRSSVCAPVASSDRLVSADGLRIAVVSAEGARPPEGCDVVVIAADALPYGYPDSTLYVVSPTCSFAMLWRHDKEGALLIPDKGLVALDD